VAVRVDVVAELVVILEAEKVVVLLVVMQELQSTGQFDL
jgi:hypothetical protein